MVLPNRDQVITAQGHGHAGSDDSVNSDPDRPDRRNQRPGEKSRLGINRTAWRTS
jgi:hypothetical protein